MRQSKIYWKYISKQNEGVTGQFKGQQQFLWKKKKHWWPSLGLIMDGLWRTVGQSAGQKSCVKFQNKKSAQAAIAEDRRRAKSPDVLAHRLSHLHNSHQGVGSGFGKHFFFPLALICLSKNRKLPVSRYMDMVSEFDATLSCWVAEGCHFIVQD